MQSLSLIVESQYTRIKRSVDDANVPYLTKRMITINNKRLLTFGVWPGTITCFCIRVLTTSMKKRRKINNLSFVKSDNIEIKRYIPFSLPNGLLVVGPKPPEIPPTIKVYEYIGNIVDS